MTHLYAQTLESLYGLRWFGAKFGLENTHKLAGLAGNPHHRLRFIHVAGTNGKGSTCAMLESIYRHAGLKVGLFTSPHLVSFRERIQVNRVPISETEVVTGMRQLTPLLTHFPADHHPTFFEVITVLAMVYFAERGCDLVIWETGLGGRLDATNVVMPVASVITNVQMDHQQWLGETVAQIASEKAGIIKPGIPVITASQEADALQVIQQTATRMGAQLHLVKEDDTRQPPLDRLHLPLAGPHQRWNAALAAVTARTIRSLPSVSSEQIGRGLANVVWPGRFQVIDRGARRVIVDGAHNPAGALTLRATMEQCFPGQKPALVLGVLRDKDWAHVCGCLAPIASDILLVPVSSDRTAAPDQLAPACQTANPTARVSTCDSLAEAMDRCEAAPLVLIAGSLYLVGEALEYWRAMPIPDCPERALNEWLAKPPASDRSTTAH